MTALPSIVVEHKDFFDILKDGYKALFNNAFVTIISFVIVAVISIALYKAFTKKRK